LILRLTLEIQRENTPYSEPNESEMLNRQTGEGWNATWYRACAMTIQHVPVIARGFGTE